MPIFQVSAKPVKPVGSPPPSPYRASPMPRAYPQVLETRSEASRDPRDSVLANRQFAPQTISTESSMKREMDVIRSILIEAENGNLNDGIDAISDESIRFHRRLLVEAGLLDGAIAGSGEVPMAVMIRKITWDGYDLIESLRSETKWVQIKSFIQSSGKSMTIEMIKLVAKKLFESIQ